MKIAIGPRYLVAFLALTILCGTSHEFMHHFAGAAACGAFGVKTFNSFSLAPGCETKVWASQLATWSGPILTYALMWFGAWRLVRGDQQQRQLGFALIFANFPINRLLFALMHFNDEQYALSHLLGPTDLSYWIANGIVWALGLPPLILAFLAIENRRRTLWFLAFLILPFMFVFLFAGLFLEDWLLKEHHVLAQPFLGIPLLIILVEILATVLYVANRRAIAHAGDRTPS